MELLLVLAAFYLGHSLVVLSPEAVLFRGRGRKARAMRGERAALVGLWPGRVEIIGERTLAGELFGGASGAPGPELRGRTVWIGRRPVFRFGTSHAAAVFRRFQNSAESPTPRQKETGGTLEITLKASLDLSGARAALEQVVSESKLLGLLGSLYLAVLFAAIPVLMFARGEEGAWWIALPLLAGLHVTMSAETWRARREVLSESRSERFVELLTGFLFPPALIHARRDLVLAATAPYHPAALAASRIEGERLRLFLSGEVCRLQGLEADAPSSALRAERRGILEIANARGWTRADLGRAPERPDPGVVEWCPRCDADFAREVARCTSCGAVTLGCAGRPA